MNRLSFLSAIVLLSMLTSCMQTRYITEYYIKNNIEKHTEGEFSTIKTYSIFKGATSNANAYLELTGYKYTNTKALVIGADRYYLARQKFKGDQTVIADISYFELTENQCRDILTNYKILQDRIKREKPRINEEIYHDFTVSKNLFISFRKSSYDSKTGFIDFWINGEKFKLSTSKIIKKLNKFMEY